MLSANTRTDIRDELYRERKRLLILAHILALVIYAIYFPYGSIGQAESTMTSIQLVVFLLLAANLYLLVRQGSLSRSALFLLFLASFIFLLSIANEMDRAIVARQIYWSLVIAPAAFYLTGRRGGALISSILFFTLWGLYAYHEGLGNTPLSRDIMISFSSIFLAIVALSFMYAHSQTMNVRRILSYSQDLAFANDELKVAALTDTLTCSYNRKFLDELLGELTGRPQPLKFSLIMIDIDHFKQVNDEYGHHVGDEILSAVTRGLQSQLREKDILGRWGGEEFIIISQGLDAETALSLAERLRKYIAAVEFPHGLRITCSFGVVEWVDHESKAELVKRADRVLYDAKKSGRNCCVLSKAA